MRRDELIRLILAVLITALVSGSAVYILVARGVMGPAARAGVVKAAWIYVGPIGDYGWTHAHDVGRKIVDEKFDWLVTTCVESVKAEDFRDVVEHLIAEGYTVIFATSFDFLFPSVEVAREHPDILVFHCSGWTEYLRAEGLEQPRNLGFYFAEFYQIYYLNGLMAGALTKTGRIGYVAAHYIPEVVRHINAFAIGALEVARYLNKSIKIYVTRIGKWYAPDEARALAEQLVSTYGVDVIAFTEDSPAIVQFCQEQYERYGREILTFSHYSPMYKYGPDVVVSGQLVHWEVIYEDILTKVREGIYTAENLYTVDYWWMLKEGAVELGADFGMPINPKFVERLKNITFPIDEKLKAELIAHGMADAIRVENGVEVISVYDLVVLRLRQMTEPNPTFDPFTGPLYSNATIDPETGRIYYEYKLRVPAGVRMSRYELWTINWFVAGIEVVGA